VLDRVVDHRVEQLGPPLVVYRPSRHLRLPGLTFLARSYY
jgi:hypothetical protein